MMIDDKNTEAEIQGFHVEGWHDGNMHAKLTINLQDN